MLAISSSIMIQLIMFVLLAASYFLSTEGLERIDTPIFEGGAANSCPSDEMRDEARTNASIAIRNILDGLLVVPECGEGFWEQVAFLDMSNSEQSCPSPWVEDSSPARSCRSQLDEGGCEAIFFPVTGRSYTRICGRATGFDLNSNDVFSLRTSGVTIDQVYVDG